ncbi:MULTISPECIES: hypothetical protein [Burkholderia]|uniref:hypothetical protein n=1 Tax=Burkholderia TaxID=32008 RepID=UPI0005A45562|nr:MULTISPECIES: hypothetical protein [Burkholderia]KST70798.1 hypothetical protein WS76_19400 [Burkholderia humptydooensis]
MNHFDDEFARGTDARTRTRGRRCRRVAFRQRGDAAERPLAEGSARHRDALARFLRDIGDEDRAGRSARIQ